MLNVEEPFAYYLDRLRKGDGEAIFGLMELGAAALPLIEKTIASMQNSSVRQDLVHVAWQTRVPAALKRRAKAQSPDRPTHGRYSFVEWIDDALSQIKTA